MNLTSDFIEKLKSGDRMAITDLYCQSFNTLMSVAVRYKRNEEDQKTIVNDSFIKLLKSLDSYNLERPFLPWAKQITKNVVIDSFRKEKNYTHLFDFDATNEGTEIEIEYDIDSDVLNEKLRHLLNSLPPATNLVFNLFAIEEYSIKEICEELNIGYETVKWHIKEARKRLRLKLQEHKTIEIH